MKRIIILILISLSIFLSAFFTVKAPIPREYYSLSSLFILVFAFPAYYFLIKLLGIKKGPIVLLVMSFFAVLLEIIALKTGFPYGGFVYGEKIGWKVLGVPWTLSFAYVPLVIGSATLASKISTSKFSVIFFSTVFLLLLDVVIDPGAVSLGFWEYEKEGVFYNVPLSNFIGWILSGSIASYIFYSLIPKHKELPTHLSYSLFGILLFWTSICLWNALFIPLICGAILLIILLKLMRK